MPWSSSMIFFLTLLPLIVCTPVPSKNNPHLPPRELSEKYFVELMRECWRRRKDESFFNRPSEFRTFVPFTHNEALRAAMNPTTEKFPLILVDKKQNFEKNPFSFFVKEACISDYDSALKGYLAKYPRAINFSVNLLNQTALHLAVIHNAQKCCELLLQKGAFIFVVDKQGNTPVDLAIAAGNVGILTAFVCQSDLLSRPIPGYASFRQAASLAVEWGLLPQA